MEELKKDVTENLTEDVIEAVEVDSVNSGNLTTKVAIGVGVLLVSGVAALVYYKKHKNNANESGEDTGNKKRFSILKKHKKSEEYVTDDFDDYEEDEE